MWERISSSLRLKTGLLVTLIAVVVFSLLLGIMNFLERKVVLNLLQGDVSKLSQTLETAIYRPMQIGDDEGTRAEFASIAETHKDLVVFLTDFRGIATYSTLAEEEGQSLLESKWGKKIAKDLKATFVGEKITEKSLLNLEKSFYFVSLKPIFNAPGCYHCHGRSQKVLGSLVIFQDVTPVLKNIKQQTGVIALICLGALVVLVAGINLFLRSNVLKPIEEIAADSKKIAKGDYSLSFSLARKDELGDLANNLGQMVGVLKRELGFSKGILTGFTSPLLVSDTEQKVVFVNQEMLDLLGLKGKPEDFLGQDVAEFFYNNKNQKTLTGEVLRTGQAITNLERELTNREGRHYFLRLDAAPLKDLDGKVIGAFGMVTDLTALKLQQQEIEKQNQNIAKAAKDALEVAQQLSSASDELAAQIEEVTEGTGKQQRMVSEAATAMEQMNASVLEVAKNASNAANLADEAKNKAVLGQEVVGEVIALIEGVKEKAKVLMDSMQKMGKQAEGIGKIITTIEDIADQTNLLALNAAIEAARAGDAGRGFAVVADEVRKLAEKTMSATKEVAQFVEEIQKSAKVNLEETLGTVQAVEDSTKKAQESGQALESIVEIVETTSDQVRNIATASEEQSAASEQISHSMEEINKFSREIADTMAQSNQAITDLAKLAMELKQIMDRLKN